jgi:hypothetical protein
MKHNRQENQSACFFMSASPASAVGGSGFRPQEYSKIVDYHHYDDTILYQERPEKNSTLTDYFHPLEDGEGHGEQNSYGIIGRGVTIGPNSGSFPLLKPADSGLNQGLESAQSGSNQEDISFCPGQRKPLWALQRGNSQAISEPEPIWKTGHPNRANCARTDLRGRKMGIKVGMDFW